MRDVKKGGFMINPIKMMSDYKFPFWWVFSSVDLASRRYTRNSHRNRLFGFLFDRLGPNRELWRTPALLLLHRLPTPLVLLVEVKQIIILSGDKGCGMSGRFYHGSVSLFVFFLNLSITQHQNSLICAARANWEKGKWPIKHHHLDCSRVELLLVHS